MLRVVIDQMRPEDYDQVRRIYEEGIASGDATFETQAPSWEAWDASHVRTCRVVAREVDSATHGPDGGTVGGRSVLGWAALSPVSSRCVYSGVAEVSVYVTATARGRGVGRALLKELIRQSEAAGFWTLQAGIFPENSASLALHKRLGFREVGRRERIGQLSGRWRDTLLLERRSRVVGAESRGACCD
jgi:L-amino acid N-acyltransferase YncA